MNVITVHLKNLRTHINIIFDISSLSADCSIICILTCSPIDLAKKGFSKFSGSFQRPGSLDTIDI
jgi:hypothetical protein